MTSGGTKGFSGESNFSARVRPSDGLGFCSRNVQGPRFVHGVSQVRERSLGGTYEAQSHQRGRAGSGGSSLDEELKAPGGT